MKRHFSRVSSQTNIRLKCGKIVNVFLALVVCWAILQWKLSSSLQSDISLTFLTKWIDSRSGGLKNDSLVHQYPARADFISNFTLPVWITPCQVINSALRLSHQDSESGEEFRYLPGDILLADSWYSIDGRCHSSYFHILFPFTGWITTSIENNLVFDHLEVSTSNQLRGKKYYRCFNSKA